MCAAEGVAPAQNDGCASVFAPIIRADPREVRWLAAASLYTWRASGVFTPPILAESLAALCAEEPSLAGHWRALKSDPDPYTRWMLGYVVQLLDGRWRKESECEPLAERYEALVRGA